MEPLTCIQWGPNQSIWCIHKPITNGGWYWSVKQAHRISFGYPTPKSTATVHHHHYQWHNQDHWHIWAWPMLASSGSHQDIALEPLPREWEYHESDQNLQYEGGLDQDLKEEWQSHRPHQEISSGADCAQSHPESHKPLLWDNHYPGAIEHSLLCLYLCFRWA